MRHRVRFLIVLLIVIFAAAWCGSRVNAQDRGGRRGGGHQMRGQQGRSGRQSHSGTYSQRRGANRAVPRQNMDRGRSYGQRDRGYSGRNGRSYGNRYGYGNRRGYSNRYRSYGYRGYGYGRSYGFGYSYGYQSECTAVLYDAYGQPHWVPGYWSAGYYSDVCIPY